MQIFSLRSRAGRTLSAVVLIGLFPVIGFRVEAVDEYRMSTLAALPWGSGPGQVGMLAATGLDYGPKSLALAADGRIFLADTANDRIVILSADGEWQGSLDLTGEVGSLVHIDDLAVGSDGTLYLLDNGTGRLLIYDPASSSMKRVELGEGRIHLTGTHVWSGQQGEVYLREIALDGERYIRRLRRLDPNGKVELISAAALTADGSYTPVEGALLSQVIASCALDAQGNLICEIFTPGALQRGLMIYDSRGRPVKELTYTGSQPIRSSAVLGADGRGAVYLSLNSQTADGRVVKLDSRGRAVATLSFPFQGVAANIYGRVEARTGSVYYLQSSPQEFRLILAACQRRWRIVWRFGS
ncbi:MAG: hypothetical protein AB1331_04980 [Bacillota bacterium]